jgi:methionine aminotransferase
VSVSSHPELRERSFVVSSFGKTYHVTGWKVGYVVAPNALMAEFRKVHQFNVFTVNTPMQIGIAQYMQNAHHYLDLPRFYQEKRDFFRAGLANSRFTLLPANGTYFQCVQYDAISSQSELDFAKWLTQTYGVAAVPVSAFYHNQTQNKVIRFCFAKKQATLEAALNRLKDI